MINYQLSDTSDEEYDSQLANSRMSTPEEKTAQMLANSSNNSYNNNSRCSSNSNSNNSDSKYSNNS